MTTYVLDRPHTRAPIAYIDGEPIYPFFGAERGYSTEGDVLVSTAADGVDLNRIWDEVNAANTEWNRERTALARLLSYPTTAVADPVPQSMSSDSFDLATEYGVPTGIRESAEALLMGYDFYDYDKATRFTWKFLRDSDSRQIQSVVNRLLEADNRLVNGTILDRLFSPVERANEFQHRVFGLWTGTDSLAPPPYLGKMFPTNTNHYLATGASVIDATDVEDMMRMVTSKGYGRSAGSRLLILANPNEGGRIATWKAGEPSRPAEGAETDGPVANHDFIPSASAPAYLMPDNIVGQVAPGEFNGLPVTGSYGPAWLIQTEYVPAGYVAVVATGGPDSQLNPIAVRQHPRPEHHGLRIIPGRDQRYPLQESFFARSFGTGVRHRGAAAVCQVTTGSTYTAPVIPK